jgi:hypothetical protein
MWAQIIGSVIGEMGKSKNDAEKMRLLNDTLARIRGLKLPENERLKAEQLLQSEASKVNPELQSAQMEALGRLKQWGSGQLTSEDRAQQELAMGEAARNGQIRQNSILQGMQARGMGNSGAALAMQQQNSQQQSTGAYQAALQNMLATRNRAMQATTQQGQLAGQMESADYRRKAAQDAINQYNANARTGVNKYNAGLGQQDFNNQLQRESLLAGHAPGVATAYGQQGQDQASLWAGLGLAAKEGMAGSDSKKDKSDPYNQYGDSGAGDLKDVPEDW